MDILYKGVDISAHNLINWSKVNGKEFDFVMIRAGFGFETEDKKFKVNIENAIRLGLHIGIYWFSYAGTVEQAVQEAEGCLNIVDRYRKYIDFPIFFDWENGSYNYVVKTYKITPTKQLVSDMAIAFMERIKKAGYKVGNYSNPDYLNRFFNDEVKNNYDTWLAHVKDSKGNPLEKSSYKGKYTMHQYSWVGRPSGFKSNTDMNYCYKDYLSKRGTISNVISPSVEESNKKYKVPNGIKFYKDVNKNVITSFSYKKSGNIFLSDHFQVKEFVSKSGGKIYSDKVKVHNKLIIILEALFAELNCSKIIVNSGYRTPEHDKAVGGNGIGQHTLGRAADIVCYDKNGKTISAKKVCCTLESMGGIYGIAIISDRSVHVDTRTQKTGVYFGDERIKGSPNILKMGYKSFESYFKTR